MSITDIFTSPLILPMFLGAVFIGVLISVCASLLGVTLVLKKYSMLGDGLAHIGFGSMAISALTEKLIDKYCGKSLGEWSMLISVPIVIAAAIFILKMSEKKKLAGDSAIALVSVSALAIGYIIYKYATGQASDVCSSMFGSASLLTPSSADIFISVMLSLTVIVIFVLWYNRIFSVSFDETFSASLGMPVERTKTIIAVLVALTVVLGMKMLGTVMISGLIVFPALSSMRLFKTFKSVCISSLVVSVCCTTVGVTLSFLINNMPIGPCVVLVNLVVFIAFTVFGKIKSK